MLILGLDNAGKTTILYKLQMGEVVTTVPSEFGAQAAPVSQRRPMAAEGTDVAREGAEGGWLPSVPS